MPISYSLLFKDCIYFIRNHFRVILTTLLFLPLLGLCLDWLFTPDVQKLLPFIKNYPNPYGDYLMKSSLLIINNMAPHHKLFAIEVISPYLRNYTTVFIIQLVVSPVFCMALIAQLATASQWSAKGLVTTLVKSLLFMVGVSFIAGLSFTMIVLLVLVLLPSWYFLFITVLLVFILLFSMLMGLLFLVYSVNHPLRALFKSIPDTFKFLKKQYKIIVPLAILSLIIRVLIITSGFLEVKYPVIPLWLFSVIQEFVGLAFVFFFLTCFYRLYTVTNQPNELITTKRTPQMNFEQE